MMEVPAALAAAGGVTGGHGGRPRDPARSEAIREAALDLVGEEGYDRVTIDAVAARAGAGKATIYRRWGSKAELVVDALTHLHALGDLADTGSLRGDLQLLCLDLTDEVGNRTVAVMRGLASAIAHDAELRAAFDKGFVTPRRAAMAEMLARAVERGEVPAGKDIDLLTSVVPALMLHRVLTGAGPLTPAFAAHVVDELLIPAATSHAHPRPTIPGGPDGR